MRYIAIRNKKSDKITIHATTCRVAQRHYSDCNIENLASDTVAIVLEGEAERDPACKPKICKCAK